MHNAQHAHKTNAQHSFELTFSLFCTGPSFTDGVLVGGIAGTVGGLVLGLVLGIGISAIIVCSCK